MKKDLDYIAGLEKAVEEKYGKDAVTNPRSRWNEEKEEDYKKQSEERAKMMRTRREKQQTIEKDGFLIKKKLVNKTADRKCPIKTCGKYSFNIKDDVYMNKFGCCYSCYIQYVEDREEQWEERRKELTDAS
jgi:DNA replication protein DnaC